jgi:hypothetical protein
MKSLVGALMVIALGVFPVSAGDSKAKSDKPAKGPQMEITPEEHDFGKVKQNQKLVHKFEIKNTGSEDLVIGRISTSCGCTAALTSDKVVKPGSTTTLEVTLETRSYKGEIERSVSIASSDPRRITTVKVKAFVEEGSTPSPK